MKHYLPIFGLLAILPVSSLALSPVEIVLRDEVVTDKTMVMLRDVAELHSGDEGIRSRLLDVTVARAPRVGRRLLLTKHSIGSLLEREVPGLFARSTWKGSSKVLIRAVGRRIDLESYRSLAKSALQEELAGDYGQLFIESVGSEQTLSLPSGQIEVIPRVSQTNRIRKRMLVWLDIDVDSHRYTSIPLWFRVDAFQDAVVATRDLPERSPLGKAHGTIHRVDVAALSDSPIRSLERLDGQRLKRPVRVDQVLLESDLEPIPAVERGDEVLVTAKSGPVTIEARVVALEDGRSGDAIRVRRNGGIDYEVLVTGRKRALAGGVMP
ncbi:flagellar basal body P-ring formation chaperone FlgA [Myxococcota bacterium]|nr:flagellar basal body P-ring formation chaperone FlgA [Myxococcota bacterium]